MANTNVLGSLILIKNNIVDANGSAIPPSAASMGYGELAINYSAKEPCLFFKDDKGEIVKIVSEEAITRALTDILGNSAADLDTLKELLAAFEGSSNDVLTLIASKADKTALTAHTGNRSNPHQTNKGHVGLGSVDNTSDAYKPVSIKQKAALNLKLDKASYTAEDVLNKLKTVDGEGSGLSSEFLDISDTRGFDKPLDDMEGNTLSTFFSDSTKGATDWKSGITMHPFSTLRQGWQLFADASNRPISDDELYFRQGFGNAWGEVRKIWHSGNSNLSTVDWNVLNLISNGRRLALMSGGDALFGNIDASPSGGAFIRTNGFNRISVLHNGNVGIGTINPKAKLDVLGNMYASTTIQAEGSIDLLGDTFALASLYKNADGGAFIARTVLGAQTAVLRSYPSGGYQLELLAGGIKMKGALTGGTFGEFSGRVTVGYLVSDGEVTSYSLSGVRQTPQAGVNLLSDLDDVNIDGAQVGDVLQLEGGVWKSKPKPTFATLEGVPNTFEPTAHNHVGSTYNVSDERLKQNIEPLTNGLELILSMKPVNYGWKDEAISLFNLDKAYSCGLIAQELELLLPDVVGQINEQYKGVNYVELVPYLIGAVKQLHENIANQNIAFNSKRNIENKRYQKEVQNNKIITALQKENKGLKERLKKIETLIANR